MPSHASAPSLLLALPDPCLLAVLQCCGAEDQRSLFSAARAHSRLHQATVLALSSITAVMTQPQQMDGVLLYLAKHGQHVSSVDLRVPGSNTADAPVLHQLPGNLQIESLQLEDIHLQLPTGPGHSGSCHPCSTSPEAAKAQGLQDGQPNSPDLHDLQVLTQLLDIRFKKVWDHSRGDWVVVTGSLLSGMRDLTRLHVNTGVDLEPSVLAGKSHLQHLDVSMCYVCGASAGVVQFLSNLQHLQQLTHLIMRYSLRAWGDSPQQQLTQP
jgi:hypothetical protein